MYTFPMKELFFRKFINSTTVEQDIIIDTESKLKFQQFEFKNVILDKLQFYVNAIIKFSEKWQRDYYII